MFLIKKVDLVLVSRNRIYVITIVKFSIFKVFSLLIKKLVRILVNCTLYLEHFLSRLDSSINSSYFFSLSLKPPCLEFCLSRTKISISSEFFSSYLKLFSLYNKFELKNSKFITNARKDLQWSNIIFGVRTSPLDN